MTHINAINSIDFHWPSNTLSLQVTRTDRRIAREHYQVVLMNEIEYTETWHKEVSYSLRGDTFFAGEDLPGLEDDIAELEVVDGLLSTI